MRYSVSEAAYVLNESWHGSIAVARVSQTWEYLQDKRIIWKGWTYSHIPKNKRNQGHMLSSSLFWDLSRRQSVVCSLAKYRLTPRKISEELGPHLHRGECFKPRKIHCNNFLCKVVPVSKDHTTKTSAYKRSLFKFDAWLNWALDGQLIAAATLSKGLHCRVTKPDYIRITIGRKMYVSVFSKLMLEKVFRFRSICSNLARDAWRNTSMFKMRAEIQVGARCAQKYK